MMKALARGPDGLPQPVRRLPMVSHVSCLSLNNRESKSSAAVLWVEPDDARGSLPMRPTPPAAIDAPDAMP